MTVKTRLSIVPTSFEKRFKMRPYVFSSKKTMPVCSTLLVI